MLQYSITSFMIYIMLHYNVIFIKPSTVLHLHYHFHYVTSKHYLYLVLYNAISNVISIMTSVT